MDRTDRDQNARPKSVTEFYDLLAPDYDSMTGFEKRFVQERPFFRVLVERYGIKTALDAGCGSGFHSLLLSELGVRVTAVDASPQMVHLTKSHARALGTKVEAVVASFEELGSVVKKQYGAVFVMGNSLPHLIKPDSLKRALKNFFDLIEPEGILFTQNLNYDRILAEHEQIQNVKDVGEKTFVRTYEYDADGIVFSIATRTKSGEKAEERSQSIRLKPLLQNDLVQLLKSVGFTDVKLFGGISMEPFNPKTSKDLVVLAKKPA
jgi:2-polyprenyl-3-methyl-5-hydroxy-6-metoxy-1,4-benzoquinol methylase